ncbi:MAG: acyl-CoA/acyl-ACP dehydrogenase [Proteobacteria bacterium]|nr:acyl-CoA/acyl-ACP dehydrogenase [Pseudomonadota bacterium]
MAFPSESFRLAGAGPCALVEAGLSGTENFPEIREAVRKLCAQFPGEYWRERDRERAYPKEFVAALTEAGFLSVLIPETYGGSGLGLAAATAVLEEVHRSGCNGGACHAQMYTMGTILKHGSEAQKQAYLPKIASGELRLQAFGVTEPTAGTDTTRISTFARREGDHYVVSGQKLWISRAEHSDLMVLLCRTTAREDAAKPSDGMSVLLVDLREAVGNGLTIRPVRTMLNHATTELFFDGLRVPAANLVGEEGKGFRYILDGMNAERILIASECIGDGRFFVDRASRYATEREVFGRPIGQNQGVQFPIARAHVQVTAAALMVDKAAAMFDAGQPCGTEANMAKMLASEASWFAADTAIQTHGGFGFAEDYDIERKFRETRLYQVAPISTNLILSHVGTHVLGMPKSF